MKIIKVLLLLPFVFSGCFLGLIFEGIKIGFCWGVSAVQHLGDSLHLDMQQLAKK